MTAIRGVDPTRGAMAQTLEEVISGIVKECFADAVIDSVTVMADVDSDGDPILRVTVVFDSEIAKIEPRKFAGLARHVLPKIREHNDAAFPVFRFMSKRDNERLISLSYTYGRLP